MAEGKLLSLWRKLSRCQRLSLTLCLLLLFYTVAGFLLVPAVLRSQLEKNLSRTLQRQTMVREVKINPYTLQVEINGFLVREATGQEPFVSFDSMRINLQAVSLFKRAIILKTFSLVNPYGKIVLREEGVFNFSDLAAGSVDQEQDKEEKATALAFSINNIDLTGGIIDFEDRVKGVNHRIKDLHIALPFLSDLPYEVEIFTKPAFEADINGVPLNMLGESKPFHPTRQSEIKVNFSGIDLTKYLSYLPGNLNFVIKNGLLDLDLAFSFIKAEDGDPSVKVQGKAALREVKVVDLRQQPLLSFPELSVEIDRAHIFRKEFYLAGLVWRQPEIYLKRLANGGLNLAGLVAKPEKEGGQESPASSGSPLLFEVGEARVADGVIHFADEMTASPFQTTLSPLNVQVNNFSTAAGKSADYKLTLTSEVGENCNAEGLFSFAPLKVAAGVGLENVSLAKYRPYYEKALRAELGAEKATAGARIDFAAADDLFVISDLGVSLGNLSLTGPDQAGKILVSELSVSEVSVNVRDKEVVAGRFTGKGGTVPLTRREDGTLNVRDFLAAHRSDEPVSGEGEASKEEAASGPAWLVEVKEVDFSGFAVTFTDQIPARPASFNLDGIKLTASRLSNRDQEKGSFDLALLLNKTGKVKVRGSAGLAPLALRLDLDLDGLPLKAAQPYVEEHLNVIIGDGKGSVKGAFSLEKVESGKTAVSFKGGGNVRQFVCLDARQADKLLAWKELSLKKVEAGSEPPRFSAGEVLLDTLSAAVVVNPDGVLNLSTIARKEKEGPQEKKTAPEAGAATSEKAEAEVVIGEVRLVKCGVDFADRSVAPPFNTGLHDIEGRIKGLASGRNVSADLDISARIDHQSPLKLTGSIHPWQDFFTDITAELRDIELSPMTPYSVKFIGYPLTKGKLHLNLHYLVEGKKLTSENKAFIDQITLGDFVQNDTAADMPVQLAISLLKNRKGEIHLNIPVSGQLDDPEFSVAGVVFKMIANLLVKAATSPFSLLGALFEGGEENQYVRFAPGRAVIAEESVSMLAELAKALADRPALKVELAGRTDLAEDGKALIQLRFDRQLKAMKFKELAGREDDVADVDAVEIAPEEYERYLKKAYKNADFERPKNFLGLLKDIPPAEMERLLYEHIVITEDDMRQLAVARGQTVRDTLVVQGPVEAERIFLVEPAGSAAGSDQLGMRVEMKLK